MSDVLLCPACTAVAPLIDVCRLARCPGRFLPADEARRLWAAEKERQPSGRVLRMSGSPNWYLAYSVGHHRVFESARTTDREAAERLLKQRLAAVCNRESRVS